MLPATSREAASGDLPQDESEAVHVGHDVGLEVVPVEGLLQHLGGHVALGAHPGVGGDVHLVGVTAGEKRKKKTFICLTPSGRQRGSSDWGRRTAERMKASAL